MLLKNNQLLIILGPTSTGKTDLALSLAKKFNGELISCDSRQVYKDLDIGTGKLPNLDVEVKKCDQFWELDGVKVWMYDVVDFKKQYTVSDYVKDADEVLEKIIESGKLPIVVGGTGLYLKALLYGFDDLSIPVNLRLRKQLETLTLQQLQNKLNKLSSVKWKSLNNSDKNNPRRLIRYIELIIMMPKRKVLKNKKKNKFDILKVGLTARKEFLYKKIDERVYKRIDQGMIEEVKKIHQKGLSFQRMRNLGLEYRILAEYLLGQMESEKELIKILQLKIHQYLKRQLTWFKKEKDVLWFDITKRDFSKMVEKRIAKWYHRTDESQD